MRAVVRMGRMHCGIEEAGKQVMAALVRVQAIIVM